MTLPRTLGLAALLTSALASIAPAQDDEQQTLIEKRDQKLAAAWLQNAAWITDYDKARAEAESSGKIIFAYFTRSYAP
ncbi:MAG: hypothetical protein AAF628_07260 [Planctomycetota bacterium]